MGGHAGLEENEKQMTSWQEKAAVTTLLLRPEPSCGLRDIFSKGEIWNEEEAKKSHLLKESRRQ